MSGEKLLGYSRKSEAGRASRIGRRRMKHPAAETLRRFIRGKGSPAENREVVAHFLRGCKICSRIVREAILPETPSKKGSW